MDKSFLTKNKHQELKGEINNIDKTKINNFMIKDILKVNYDIDIDYNNLLNQISIQGVINYSILAIDARDGKEFEYSSFIDWEDEYIFSNPHNKNTIDNIILGKEFILDDYIIEQININIPYNISKNNGIINNMFSRLDFLTEEQYEDLESKQDFLSKDDSIKSEK